MRVVNDKRILLDRARRHGMAASRYRPLLLTTMAQQGDEPERPGSIEVPRLPGVRAHATRLSRLRIAAAQRLHASTSYCLSGPRRRRVVEILGVLHDRMVPSRAARMVAKEADKGSSGNKRVDPVE